MPEDIGARLRAARQAQGLTLRNVAAALGVSASLLSQVETGKTQPSVSTLYALVNHLGLSLDTLLLEAPVGGVPAAPRASIASREDSPVQRSPENPVIEMENGVRWERLAAPAGGSVDPLLVTYAPGASSSVEGRMMRHSGREYAYLLSGELTLHVEFDTYSLHPGDSLCFDSVRPHMYVNHGDGPARGLWFVVGRKEFTESMPQASMPAHRPEAGRKSAVDVLQAMDALRFDIRSHPDLPPEPREAT